MAIGTYKIIQVWATFRVHTLQVSSSQLKLLPPIATASFPSLSELTGATLNGARSLSPSSLRDLLNSKQDIIKSILDHSPHVHLPNQLLHSSPSSPKTLPALQLWPSWMDSRSVHWQWTHPILLLSRFKYLWHQFQGRESVFWSPQLQPLRSILYSSLILSMIQIFKI